MFIFDPGKSFESQCEGAESPGILIYAREGKTGSILGIALDVEMSNLWVDDAHCLLLHVVHEFSADVFLGLSLPFCYQVSVLRAKQHFCFLVSFQRRRICLMFWALYLS